MISTEWFIGCDGNLDDALNVRRAVFVDEQGMPEETDRDGTDGDAFLLVAYDGGKPAATGRVHLLDGVFTIGRVAVLPEARGQGLGDFVVRLLLRRAFEMGAEKQYVDSRADKTAFYERFGFRQTGEPFERGGARHVRMEREGDVFGKCY